MFRSDENARIDGDFESFRENLGDFFRVIESAPSKAPLVQRNRAEEPVLPRAVRYGGKRELPVRFVHKRKMGYNKRCQRNSKAAEKRRVFEKMDESLDENVLIGRRAEKSGESGIARNGRKGLSDGDESEAVFAKIRTFFSAGEADFGEHHVNEEAKHRILISIVIVFCYNKNGTRFF